MDDMPFEISRELIDAIVRGARRGHEIAARTHNEDELWDEMTLGVNRHRLSLNWIMHEASGLEGVAPSSAKGGSKHLSYRGRRFSFHNGGTHANWDPNTYDFDRGARGTMADSNGQQSMLAALAVEPSESDLDGVRELDVVMVGNAMAGCEIIYLGAPMDSEVGRRWGWITTLWAASGGDGEGGLGHGEADDSGGPTGPTGGYDGFRSMPEDDVPPLTVKPAAQPAKESESS